MSNFIFFHSVFKRFVQQTGKNKVLFRKRSKVDYLLFHNGFQQLSQSYLKQNIVLCDKGLTLTKIMAFKPITRRQILDSSKLKEFADDNFKLDENGRKLSKRVENTVGKGEIARYEQFLLFPQCFQKACFPGASKGVIVWEWVKLIPYTPLSKSIYRGKS